MRIPLRMVRAAPVRITDSNALHVALSQKMQHDPHPLRSHADKRHVDLVAGRNMPLSAKYVSRHDRESQRCGTNSAQELASGNLVAKHLLSCHRLLRPSNVNTVNEPAHSERD